MKRNDAFPSKYLKAEDLDGEDLTVTITDAKYEEFKDRDGKTDNKPVLVLQGEKPLVLNLTNWKTIEKLLGSDDTDNWAGKQITLYPTEIDAFGETRLAIRVRLKAPAKAAKAATVNGDSPVPADGSTEFWKAAKQRGLDNAAALPAAKQAMSGAVSWKDAIELLPEGKKAATVDADEIPFN